MGNLRARGERENQFSIFMSSKINSSFLIRKTRKKNEENEEGESSLEASEMEENYEKIEFSTELSEKETEWSEKSGYKFRNFPYHDLIQMDFLLFRFYSYRIFIGSRARSFTKIFRRNVFFSSYKNIVQRKLKREKENLSYNFSFVHLGFFLAVFYLAVNVGNFVGTQESF